MLQRLSYAPPYRILLVASSGENALSLLVDATVASVDATDLNSAQLHLCELRRRDLQACLRFHQGNLVEQPPALSQSYGPFDLISISNIADWMSEEQFGAIVQRARVCLVPGGALLARTATGRAMIHEVTAASPSLASDPGFNQALEAVERGPWFRTIAVGFHG